MQVAAPSIVVLGSVNLDLVARVNRLPTPGETVTGAALNRYPGGKGANQALAARRLGANVHLVANVGRDVAADEALHLLRTEGVDLSYCSTDDSMATGIALICVAESGENQIVVAPGANRTLRPENLRLPNADALICQLEVPADTLCQASRRFSSSSDARDAFTSQGYLISPATPRSKTASASTSPLRGNMATRASSVPLPTPKRSSIAPTAASPSPTCASRLLDR